MNKFKLILIPIFLLISSTSLYADQKLSPVKATDMCMQHLSDKFNKYGHSYTTFMIADLAGRSENETLTLTYFSQYPDEDKQYDAIVNAFKNKIPFLGDEFSRDAVKKLHSLHGGGRSIIDARRKSLENAIAVNLKNQNDIWKAGLLIHAYADTYAHTDGKYGAKDEKAFGPFAGHAFHSILGKDPDKFTDKNNIPKYTAYVDHLFKLLKTSKAHEKAFLNYKNLIDNNDCKSDECFMKKALPATDLKKITMFKNCMDKNMRSLTQNEVQGVLDQIK
ncbi:hypothetical protein NDN13_05145 [Acinetobacter sp. C32I]|uniref:hypothetical protein n=1 Tax=Acinetobacter sp. C32I TaxID=2950074 RepID=UPI0020376727|nr:hypothetical protein [Acinetobacter sp. C32I]USA54583.1 hypothetical protein NDN13_05145 [Acinetobacter sp. C32I]